MYLPSQRGLKYLPQTHPELLHPVDFAHIRSLTAKMQHQIAQGTLSAPSWRLIRNAKLAAHIYAPLGTEMSLGDYIRVVRMFLEAFKAAEAEKHRELGLGHEGSGDISASASDGELEVPAAMRNIVDGIVCLSADLKVRARARMRAFWTVISFHRRHTRTTYPPMASKMTGFAVHSLVQLSFIAYLSASPGPLFSSRCHFRA